MEQSKIRSWWSHRQGLDSALAGKSAPEVLQSAGWARSVGGSNPYLTLFSRAGLDRENVDAAVAKLVDLFLSHAELFGYLHLAAEPLSDCKPQREI